jgi:hypothetical protein
MNTLDQKNYLLQKYIEEGLLNLDSWFDPFIYPNEDYIPICTQCNLDFENFKTSNIQGNMEVELKHPKACLWCDYFIKKIKNICPTAKIVRKKKR